MKQIGKNFDFRHSLIQSIKSITTIQFFHSFGSAMFSNFDLLQICILQPMGHNFVNFLFRVYLLKSEISCHSVRKGMPKEEGLRNFSKWILLSTIQGRSRTQLCNLDIKKEQSKKNILDMLQNGIRIKRNKQANGMQ